MSKLYSLYQNCKQNDEEKLYLFKSGIFFIALSNDAITLSNKLNLKLTKLNDSVVKCGFPISSIEKYQKIFSNNNIKYEIVDANNSTLYSPKDYKINSKITELINYASNIETDDISVSEAYEIIENIKKQSLDIKENL